VLVVVSVTVQLPVELNGGASPDAEQAGRLQELSVHHGVEGGHPASVPASVAPASWVPASAVPASVVLSELDPQATTSERRAREESSLNDMARHLCMKVSGTPQILSGPRCCQ
jgi:hypothetical protein